VPERSTAVRELRRALAIGSVCVAVTTGAQHLRWVMRSDSASFSIRRVITPKVFHDHPESRLYGLLMRDYRQHANALQLSPDSPEWERRAYELTVGAIDPRRAPTAVEAPAHSARGRIADCGQCSCGKRAWTRSSGRRPVGLQAKR